jgi:heme oxygenase
MTVVVPLMDRLRDATSEEHRRVELLPFAAALAVSELPLDSYVAFLDALCIVHSSLEEAMASTEHPVIRAIWEEPLRQTPRLQRDLDYFAPRKLAKSPIVSIRAQLVAQRIRQRAEEDPLSVLGYAYVLAGATLGGKTLKAQVVHSFGLEDSNGLAYLSSHEDEPGSPWGRFRRRMNAAPIDEKEQERIVNAAKEAFVVVGQIVEAVYPFDATNSRMLAHTLNFEAGRHAVPVDENELRAALRAGERTWHRFPYYKCRYGARGARFTSSDSAWLVTLAEHEQAIINKQISWLGHVLSARGMPQWLLESHLVMLHEALVSAVPTKAPHYDKLLRAAGMLAEGRRKQVSDDVMAACGAAFGQYVGDEWSKKLPEAGQLLAAAVADEKQGIKLAVPSLETWMADDKRFPKHWIDAVRATIQMARENSR